MNKPLQVLLGEGLRSKGWPLAVGESCTGGLVGHLITNVPGASEYFLGGIIAYSNEAKERLLGVSEETLSQFGAVSREVALEMAEGARRAFEARVGAAVTGIAGPGGGGEGKPVGLTWIAVSSQERKLARKYVWEGNREENKMKSAHAALRLLLLILEETG